MYFSCCVKEKNVYDAIRKTQNISLFQRPPLHPSAPSNKRFDDLLWTQ